MKRNWALAAVIFGFIVLYQIFVLSPASKVAAKKQAEAQQLTSATETPISPISTAEKAPLENPITRTPPSQNAASTVIQDPFTVSLGEKRSVVAGSGGLLNRAVLEDFFPLHGKKGDKKELLIEGISLHSTSAKVQQCLGQLRRINDVPVTLKATTGDGTCEVTYLADEKHRSLLNARVTLQGFPGESGDFFLRIRDALGSKEAQDQNFLTYKIDGSKKSLRAKTLFDGARFSGKVDWLAWGDRYFSTIVVPKGKYTPSVYVDAQTVDLKSPEATSSFGILYPLNPEKTSNAYSYEYALYFGTRDPRVLEEIDPILVDSVDLGFFSLVARAMLWALHMLNQIFHNYGVSIIALTLIVRLAFWPLNRKAFASSLAMKNIQPEVVKIREKYGKDSSKAVQMNSEMMALYKKHKVNPLGGCLPMLLQIPIFIGLYGALNHSIDLYGSPFFGWIQNLSDKDPYYIFPALWTISLIGYMQLNPQATNSQPGMPDMKWMFMGMNVFFGYLSANWPAGLTLYLFVSNLVGVFQQLMMKREQNKNLSVIQEGA